MTGPDTRTRRYPNPGILVAGCGALVLLALLLPRFAWTTEDAFIAYRYARNLASGSGLVFNAGERVEGYSNLLWTLTLAATIELGLDVDLAAKALGASSLVVVLFTVFGLARRVTASGVDAAAPVLLTATSVPLLVYSASGLETGLFAALMLLGVHRFLAEEEDPAPPARRLSVSPFLFAAASLVRPEAPLFVAAATMALGADARSRRSLARIGIVAATVAVQILFRLTYYSSWLPRPFTFKVVGNPELATTGLSYLLAYATSCPLTLVLGAGGGAIGWRSRSRAARVLGATALAALAFPVIVGGDWMRSFRLFALLDPLLFVLVLPSLGAVYGLGHGRTGKLLMLLLLALLCAERARAVHGASQAVEAERRSVARTFAPTARWLRRQPPGLVAVGDVGRVGWVSDLPILDLYGLVHPEPAVLVVADASATSRRFVNAFFAASPRYVVMRSRGSDCEQPILQRLVRLQRDARFTRRYEGRARFSDRAETWCVYASLESPDSL